MNYLYIFYQILTKTLKKLEVEFDVFLIMDRNVSDVSRFFSQRNYYVGPGGPEGRFYCLCSRPYPT